MGILLTSIYEMNKIAEMNENSHQIGQNLQIILQNRGNVINSGSAPNFHNSQNNCCQTEMQIDRQPEQRKRESVTQYANNW